MTKKFFLAAGILAVFSLCPGKAGAEMSRDDVLLLCHFEGNTSSETGQKGAAPKNIEYKDGYFGKGLFLQELQSLHYSLNEDVMDMEKGSLELWFQPNWNADDIVNTPEKDNRPVFFDIRSLAFYLLYDNSQRLKLNVYCDNRYHTAVRERIPWEKGTWHHIVATWDCPKGELKLFVDGCFGGAFTGLASNNYKPAPLNINPDTRPGRGNLFIGSWDKIESTGGPWGSVNGVIDELVVYNRVISFREIQTAYTRTKPLTFAVQQEGK